MSNKPQSSVSSSTTKKVHIARFGELALEGYVNPTTYLRVDNIEFLDRTAQMLLVPLQDTKGVYFVRDFDGDVENKQKKNFASRPKQLGLWIRLNFRDGDMLEGVVENNMLLMNDAGITITPPEPNSFAQRVFVPRSALSDVTVVGVVGKSTRTRQQHKHAASVAQLDLFQQEKD